MPKYSVIIPARGGSKGLPRKNITNLCGKPLVAWTIEAALGASYVEGVYVTSDDTEIASVSRAYGASVIDRPLELAGDTASSESALLHALDVLEDRGQLPEYLVFMQCTSPLTASEDVDRAINKLIEEDADTCLTVSDFHYFVWGQNPTGSAHGINHDKDFRPRRQDRDPQFAENGAIYVMEVAGFRQAKHRFFGKTVLSIMPTDRSAEIDESVDLKVVGLLLREQLRKAKKNFLPSSIAAVAFDFDGVMTDNRVWVGQTGEETVACNRSDGWGLDQLKMLGLRLAILSTETNSVVSTRCQKLGIDCFQALGDQKLEALYQWSEKHHLSLSEVIFVGNDVNDISCLRAAGCGVVTADAHSGAKSVADFILDHPGGHGAVREISDLILASIQQSTT